MPVLPVLLYGLVLVALGLHERACAPSNGKGLPTISVVFRYDDYSTTSDTALEKEFFAIFAQHEIPCLVAVIPCVCDGDIHRVEATRLLPLSPSKALLLKDGLESGQLEIALHGYSHQTILDRRHGGYTEFRGLDMTCQRETLAQGRAFLEQVLDQQVACFVPPWNSYDENTVSTLDELGFHLISAGVEGKGLRPDMQNARLKHLPATCGLHQLKLAVEGARLLKDSDPIIVVLFHSFDFRENDRVHGRVSCAELSELLTWIKAQADVRPTTMMELATSNRDLSADRLRANMLSRYPRLLLPTSLLCGRCNVYLSPREGIVQRHTWLWRAALCLYLPLFIVSGALGIGVAQPILRWARSIVWVLASGGPVVLVWLFLRSFRDSYVSAGEGIRFVFLLGGYLGFVFAYGRAARKARSVARQSNRACHSTGA